MALSQGMRTLLIKKGGQALLLWVQAAHRPQHQKDPGPSQGRQNPSKVLFPKFLSHTQLEPTSLLQRQ